MGPGQDGAEQAGTPQGDGSGLRATPLWEGGEVIDAFDPAVPVPPLCVSCVGQGQATPQGTLSALSRGPAATVEKN